MEWVGTHDHLLLEPHQAISVKRALPDSFNKNIRERGDAGREELPVLKQRFGSYLPVVLIITEPVKNG